MVTTEADINIQKVRDNTKDSIGLLSDIIIERTWGSEDFSSTFKTKMKKSFDMLLEIKEMLG